LERGDYILVIECNNSKKNSDGPINVVPSKKIIMGKKGHKKNATKYVAKKTLSFSP
jgi:hypothetical protein